MSGIRSAANLTAADIVRDYKCVTTRDAIEPGDDDGNIHD